MPTYSSFLARPCWRAWIAVALATAGLCSPAELSFGAVSDYALVNGKVYLGEKGWVTAVAISGDQISAVGDEGKVRRALPKDARIVDLKGAVILPGLHDMHVHPLSAGSGHGQCQIDHDANIQLFTAALRSCVQNSKQAQWILGGRWTAGFLEAANVNRKTLDRISAGHPVALTDSSGHNLWVNSQALAAAGIAKGTPNPPGGIIERDLSGEPTGVLRDSAMELVRSAMPPPDPQMVVEQVRWALAQMARYGITTLTDAAVDDLSLPAYMSLAGDGQLRQHVRGCLRWRTDSPYFESLFEKRESYRRGMFKLDCVKVFMDGVPTEGHTAAMLSPYEITPETPPGAPPKGLLMVPPAVLDPLVIRLDEAGVLVKFHAAGDAAVRAAMDAIAAARSENGNSGPRHEVAHLPYVDPADMARAKPLGLTLEFSPYLWYRQPIVTDMETAVGRPRNLRAWPVKEGLATGAPVIVGSDWPVVPSVNPWPAIEALVTRKQPGGEGAPYGAREAIALTQALRLFTEAGAKQFGGKAGDGTIAPGAPADLVVIDRNPFEIPITAVHEVRTLKTIVGGAIIFDAADDR